MTPGGSRLSRRGRRALFFLALLFLSLTQSACATPPLVELSRVRSDIERAQTDGASRYAPEEVRQAWDMLRAAQREVTLQSARFEFRRDYRESISLLQRARFFAVQARRLTQIRRETSRRDAQQELAKLEDSLERSREIKRFLTPRDPAIHRLLVGAGIDQEVARKNLKASDFPRALETAKSGNARVREAEQRLLSSMVRFTSHPDLAAWRKCVEEAIRRSRSQAGAAIVVDKLRRRMTLYRAGKPTQTYTVDLGLGGMERKLRSGDDATPEGLYKIEEVRGPGQTRYHRAFLLDYPNATDRRRFEQARREGQVPRGADPGGLIEIHGEGGRDKDWTKGCVALTNREMDQLASMVRVGTTVAIVGYNPQDQENPW
ncbi:MAG TPA: L,D-transpeptidase family protein [Candidatus Polarisedimenticolia bacterium]|jgi:hypothetical protein|nr:L,D-transpeptidase family protein [Candidatus Polarisedimenticolia bacterium]